MSWCLIFVKNCISFSVRLFNGYLNLLNKMDSLQVVHHPPGSEVLIKNILYSILLTHYKSLHTWIQATPRD